MLRESNSSKQTDLIQMLEQIETLADKCIRQVSHAPQKQREVKQSRKKSQNTPSVRQMNFNLNSRAFVKKYATSLSGPKKFVLILAYLSKGQVSKEISLANIKKMWGSMSGLIGMEFNIFYAGRAKDNGWVDPVKRGVYKLTESGKEMFDHE